MTLNLHLPMKSDMLKPTITVVGVGGAGGNAVNNMITAQLEGVNFVVANTDAQALDHSLAERTIQLGAGITKGLGAGANPQVGKTSAEEVADEIMAHIEGSNMVFITAGMGGGTGTGAAPVVAKLAREQGILTVAVVTKPFQFEGTHRMKLADAGLKELQECVDTLIIIPNQNLFRIANDRTTFADAFKMADEVLHSGVRGVTDLMVKPGLINLDFSDIRTVMREMGKAMMGTGEATGEKRAVEAAESAISNPLLDDVSLKGARALLINITGGPDMTLFEVDEAANRIRQEVDPEANIIFGSAFNDSMEGRMRVSVVATGIDAQPPARVSEPVQQEQPRKLAIYSGMAARASESPMRAAPRNAGEVARNFNAAEQAEKSQYQPQPQPSATYAPAQETRPEKATTHAPDLFAAQNAEPVAPQPRVASGGGLRIAPAETPTSAPVRSAPVTAPVTAPVSQAPRREQRETQAEHSPADDNHGSVGIFQRIANVSRAISSRHEAAQERAEETPQRSPHVEQKPRVESTRKPSLSSEEEQYIDIPAFLRRQAN